MAVQQGNQASRELANAVATRENQGSDPQSRFKDTAIARSGVDAPLLQASQTVN
jgi:hypothetical protein